MEDTLPGAIYDTKEYYLVYLFLFSFNTRVLKKLFESHILMICISTFVLELSGLAINSNLNFDQLHVHMKIFNEIHSVPQLYTHYIGWHIHLVYIWFISYSITVKVNSWIKFVFVFFIIGCFYTDITLDINRQKIFSVTKKEKQWIEQLSMIIYSSNLLFQQNIIVSAWIFF